MSVVKCAAYAAFVVALSYVSLVVSAQTVTRGGQVTATLTIQAIDPSTRSITLRDEKGQVDTVVAGPEITRFNELKVGDKIRATYYESTVFELRKPGAQSNPATESVGAQRSGSRPGGTVSTQQTMTVTVQAVDPTVPSITVMTTDGRTLTRKVDDAKNLEGVKPGDRIDITSTQALLVVAEPAQ